METPYSGKFLTSLVKSLQDVCQKYLRYSQFVEVSGYVCVEIDNMKKERYVLSELLQSSGSVVSESFCTKVLTSASQKIRYESQHRGLAERDSNSQRSLNSSSAFLQQPLQNQDYFSQDWFEEQDERSASSKTLRCFSQTDLILKPVQKSIPAILKVEGRPGHQDEHELSVDHGDRLTSNLASDFPYTQASHTRSQQGEEVATDFQDIGCVVDSGSVPREDEEVIDLELFEGEDDEIAVLPVAVQQDDILRYGSGQQRKSQLSPGTLSTVRNSVKQFKKFIFDQSGLDTDLFSTPPERLNMLLLDYFQKAKKVGGGELTARTLKNLQVRLDMFLKDGGYPFSILRDKQFQSSRDYLKQRLSESGKSISQLHSPVNDYDMEILFQANQLGVHSCETILNTLWFMNSKYFAIRRPAEHYGMKWRDLTLEVDAQGQEFICRPIQGSMFLKIFTKPESPNRCFVNFYKQYMAMRPKQMMDEMSPFYLKIVGSRSGEPLFGSEALSYTHFIHIWRKMVIVSRLPSNKKIF